MSTTDVHDIQLEQSAGDGAYHFGLQAAHQILELSSILFLDGSGSLAVPSGGMVTVQVTVDGVNWLNIDGGLFSANEPPKYPPFYIGFAKAGRVVLSGVTGAATFIADLRQHSDQAQMMRDLLTSDRRVYRRLRVDVAQTGFFEGREFRTFFEWGSETTGTYLIKAVVPINIILFSLGVNLEAGSVRIETLAGGTPSGEETFPDTLPIFPTNTMLEKPQPAYSPQVVLTGGSSATLTGGVLLDVLRAKTSNVSNFASSVGSQSSDERGVIAGTYHFQITLANATGIFRARWEERP